MISKAPLETKPAGGPAGLDQDLRSAPADGGSPGTERDPGCRRFVENASTHQSRQRGTAAACAQWATRLSANEEHALAERIKMGDSSAQKQLVTANLALVFRAVRGYKRSGIPLEDLIQEGNLGLIRAAQSFDPSARAARFATYARFWIQASLVRALARNGSLIRVPERWHLLRLHYRRAIGELADGVPVESAASSSEPPSLDEIARHMGVPANRLKRVGLTECHRILTMGLGELAAADGPSTDQDVVQKEDFALVYVALRRLSPFEAWVIRERYGLAEYLPEEGNRSTSRRRTDGGHTAECAPAVSFSVAAPARSLRPSQALFARSYLEIGYDCGISAERVRQVEQTALEKLRALLAPDLVEADTLALFPTPARGSSPARNSRTPIA